VQTLAAWFMQDAPFTPHDDDYLVYTYNRFQACRFGLDAVYVDPASGEHMALRDHIRLTMQQIERHAENLGTAPSLALLRNDVQRDHNDARWLREVQSRERLLAEVIRQAAHRFRAS
jgi:carboxylate-amine ligase